MLAFVKRYLAYRRLRRVMTLLPRRLETSFGASETYTPKQVRRAIMDLRLPEGVWLHGLALACTAESLEDEAVMVAAQRDALRAEMVDVFDLPGDFTLRDLRSRNFAQHHPAPENEYSKAGH